MHDLNNLSNVGNQYQRDSIRSAEIAAGVYAANRVTIHMRQVEEQNDAMLHQMWVQTELMSGRSMGDINRQLASEVEQRDIAAVAMFWFWVRAGVVLMIGAVVYVWSSYKGWLGMLALGLAYVVTRMTVGRYRNLTTPTVNALNEGRAAPPHVMVDHRVWVADFQTEQALRLKTNPPTEDN